MGARVGRIELQGPLQVRERPVGLIPGAVEGSKLQVGRDTFVALQRLSVMTLCFVQRIALRQDLADGLLPRIIGKSRLFQRANHFVDAVAPVQSGIETATLYQLGGIGPAEADETIHSPEPAR